MWPPWLTDVRCLRIICVGLVGTCWAPPGGFAVTWIALDCLAGYAQWRDGVLPS